MVNNYSAIAVDTRSCHQSFLLLCRQDAPLQDTLVLLFEVSIYDTTREGREKHIEDYGYGFRVKHQRKLRSLL
jgi:hypothetical protein